MRECIADRSGLFGPPRQAVEHILVNTRGPARIARLLEELPLLQQRRKVSRLDLQRLLERLHLLRASAERLEAARKIRPECGMPGLCRRRAHEKGMSLIG